MKAVFKRLLRWDKRAETGKDKIRRRFVLWRYRARNVLATIASLFPFSLPFLLTIVGTDKHQPHGHLYGRIYERYFRRFRYRRMKLLEIGIGGYESGFGGESLTAWRAYFPLGRFVACDLYPRPGMASRRTHIYQMDQSSVADLERLAAEEGPFDIIIDDGSHVSQHQILTFRHLFGALKDHGIYVVEDAMTSYWSFAGWGGASIGHPDFRFTCMAWFTELAHYVNQDEFEERAGADPEMLALGPSIGHILFAKNLIIVQKDQGPKGMTMVGLLKQAAARLASTTQANPVGHAPDGRCPVEQR